MDGEASAFGAANHRHHRYMVFGKKQRYIEVFQCSGEDMSLVLNGGGAAGQAKQPLLSPGMLEQQPPPLYPDPLVSLPQLVSMPPPLALLQQQPGLLPQPHLSLPPPSMQQQQLALLQQLQLQGLQQQGLLQLQQPGLMGLQPQQQLMLYPRLQQPLMQHHQPLLHQQQSLLQQQPRFLLPSPQLAQPGTKRSHEQAFLAAGQYQAGGLPPKRPPVMYGTPPLEQGSTPPPQPAALLPTPHSLPSYPV